MPQNEHVPFIYSGTRNTDIDLAVMELLELYFLDSKCALDIADEIAHCLSMTKKENIETHFEN